MAPSVQHEVTVARAQPSGPLQPYPRDAVESNLLRYSQPTQGRQPEPYALPRTSENAFSETVRKAS
jgi:hypothetical protein